VAEKKAKGPDGADKDITEKVDPADEAEGRLDEATPTKAAGDDGADTADELIQGIRDMVAPVEVPVVPTEEAGDEPGDEGSGSAEAPDSILSMFRGLDATDELDGQLDDEADDDDVADDEDSSDDEDAADDDIPVEAAARPVRKARPVDKAQPVEAEVTSADQPKGNAPVKKNRPTRSRAEATALDAPKKTGPVQFVGQVVQELKKVSWPTSSQLLQFFLVVLIFVVFMIAFIGLLDVLFGWLMLKLFS